MGINRTGFSRENGEGRAREPLGIYGIMAQDFIFSGMGLKRMLMITVNVLLFSTIRALIGQKNLVIELPEGATVRDLKLEISRRYPDSSQAMMTMLTAVDRVFSSDETRLDDQSEVAFFPFVSGG